MAGRLGSGLFIITLSIVGMDRPLAGQAALAAGLDQRGEAAAKEATRLFKQGRYEEAAPIYAKLSVDYPDMNVFERNVGACFYHLRQPEPALSNLRHYLAHKKNIGAEDKATVERWIDEMEKLRAQREAASVTAKPSALVTGNEPPTQPKAVGDVGPASQFTAATPPVAGPEETKSKSAGLDLSVQAGSLRSMKAGSPVYKTWWFWTGAVAVVAAGTFAAFLLADCSTSPCADAGMTCLVAK